MFLFVIFSYVFPSSLAVPRNCFPGSTAECNSGDDCHYPAKCDGIHRHCPKTLQVPDQETCLYTNGVCFKGRCIYSICNEHGLSNCNCKRLEQQCFHCCWNDDRCIPSELFGIFDKLGNPYVKKNQTLCGNGAGKCYNGLCIFGSTVKDNFLKDSLVSRKNIALENRKIDKIDYSDSNDMSDEDISDDKNGIKARSKNANTNDTNGSGSSSNDTNVSTGTQEDDDVEDESGDDDEDERADDDEDENGISEATPSEDDEVTPSEDDESTPSEDDEGTPIEDDEGTPSEDDEGTLNEDDEGTPSEDDQVTPSEDDEGTPSVDEGKSDDNVTAKTTTQIFTKEEIEELNESIDYVKNMTIATITIAIISFVILLTVVVAMCTLGWWFAYGPSDTTLYDKSYYDKSNYDSEMNNV